ncbi:GapS6b family protein [Vibrio crassostreae]|uniref:GapS6b family protein n=1 Tax=Vibrio crassostreae TaxID=246167 RepID=UPI001B3118AE|nr:hypothetical protein [Vibrio crassostreae]
MANGSGTQSTGIGHNLVVAEHSKVSIGDITITSLSSTDLVSCTKQFLHAITHRDWSTAKAYLTALSSVGSLDGECNTLLQVLACKIDIALGKEPSIDRGHFVDLLRSPRSDSVIKDVVESIYVHFLSISSEAQARERYEASSHKGSFTDEVFFEKLASKQHLLEKIARGLSDAYEHELCSWIRCAIRCEDFQQAVELSEVLRANYPSNNSEVLLALSKSYLLNRIIDGRQFWLLNREQMKDLEEQISNSIHVLNNTDDFRNVHVAAILLATTHFQASDLIDICLENIDEAKKVIPNICDMLPKDTEVAGSSISVKQILKQDDLQMSEVDFSQVSTAVVSGSIKNREVKKWLDKGGDVRVTEESTRKFIKLSLSAIACEPNDKRQKAKLSQETETFIEEHSEQLTRFSILAIHQLCENLRRAELPLLVVQVIEPFLPEYPWCSPILDTYSEALLQSDQLSKLDNLLANMEGVSESYRFMAVKIERAISTEDFPKAIQLAEQAIKKFPKSCYYWAVLLRAFHLADLPSSRLTFAMSEMPNGILSEYSDEGIRLLHLLAKTDLPLAESFILEWFIDNPVGMAVNVTNLHLNNLDNSKYATEVNYPSDRCSAAVVYSSGKRHYTKLLVDGCGEHSEYLLDLSSPLGELLDETDIGEEFELGVASYRVVEKLPPIVGAFRISTNIRNDINPGTDCFYQLFIEGDGVEDILKHIDSMSQQKQLVDAQIDGKAIPLLMRLNETHKHDLMRGAFLYLCDRESNLNFELYSDGEVIRESVVLDAMSLAYLSITGFCHGFIRTNITPYITRETKEVVSSWLEQMGRADYLSIAKVDNGFIKMTADDVSKDDSFSNLRILLDHCSLISPQSINMPEMITKVRDILDVSHYSSLKASISNSIPVFCLDSMFCSLYGQLGISLANVNQLVTDAKVATQMIESRHVECHIHYGLAVPIMHQDVVELCRQKEKGQYLAAQILKMYPNSYPSADTALSVLTECCLKSICSTYINLEGKFNLSEWRFTEHIVYAACEASMLCLKGDTCEQRISGLISAVLGILSSTASAQNMALQLFRRFVQGHFLCAEQIDIELMKLKATEFPHT